MIIAQITDSHVVAQGHRYYDIVDTNAFLARAIAHLNALDPRPDVVVATGDLVSKGTNKEYAALREILSDLTIPIYVIPGNHDESRGPAPAPLPTTPICRTMVISFTM